MTYESSRADGRTPPPGQWRTAFLRDRETGEIELNAWLTCPQCETETILGPTTTEHQIGDDGTVTPSVDCSCGDFHEHVTLLGWNPEAQPRGA